MGIIVQTEIPWVNVCGVRADEDYFHNIHSQMKEMIVSLYNHPSIVFWGMWNELADWGNKEEFQGSLDERKVVDESARLYMNDKGIVTRDRKTKKDVFYLYKALWNHSEETVYITGKRHEKRPEGKDFMLTVYSNAPSLKLYENGELLAEKTSSEEPSGVIWKFPGLTMKSGNNSYKVVSPTGHSDTITFRSL